MEFRILGPLEVVEEGNPVPLGGPKQRALLALLLMNANVVVPSEQLLEELWRDKQPASGMTALQVRISQLRRALEHHGGDAEGGSLLATRAPGYVLRVEHGRLDLHRFEDLLAAGNDALAGGEPLDAAERFREALALWRGPVLADVAGEPFVQSEIARLDELRLTALEARIDADLALGNHAGLVSELESLAARHPLREGLRARLMLALYRSGRQADALAVYRDGRRLLVETHGLEPGEALRRLEAAILQQDPALTLPAPSGPSPSSADASPVLPVGERKVVTVLFADIVGSTELVTSRDPEQARALFDQLFDALAAEIDAAGGTVEKFIGDAVMAVFGAPVAQEDHAERALHTTLALARRTAELFGGTISLGIGVASGEAVVGRAREGGSLVTGAVVNLGARLEQAAGPRETLVHERTARAARGAFEFGAARVVAARGLPDGVECRPLVRALALTRSRGVGGLEPVFVGRDGEIDLLRAAYRRVAEDGRPALITLIGEAGVGKSALVRRFWEWLPSQRPDPLRRTGQCLSYGRAVTYRPLGDVLREQLGLLATDPPEIVRRRLAGREILGLTLGLDVASDLHPLAAREQLHEALADFFEELVRERPAAVLLEDLHWAEEPLLDLVERLVRDVAGPLLVIATARPELLASRPSWGGGSRDALTIGLDPLPRPDAELLIEELVGGVLPDSLCALLVERSEGNPFFAEELLGSLVDHGYVTRRGSVWTLHEQPDLAIPDSLHDVIAARIDMLPPAEKEALQAAAVIGRTFWRGALRELVEGSPPDISALEQRDFVRRRSTSSIEGEREFVFKHALTREVAFAGLPKARRLRLHAAFADWLERIGEGRDEHAAVLAHHYAESVRADDAALAWPGGQAELEPLRRKALAWLRRAGELAVGRYEIDEGLALLHRALELETADTERCRLWCSIGRANALKFDGEAFWTALEKAIEVAPDDRTRAEISSELAVEAFVRAGMWTTMPAIELVGSWIAQALRLAEPGTRARARALVAKAFADLDDVQAAAEAAAIAERLDDAELCVYAWDACGVVAMANGDYETAWRWRTRRLDLLDRVTDPDLRTIIGETPYSACVATCRFDQARDIARLHDELTSGLTPHHRMHGVAILVEVEELLGGWQTIRTLEERVRDAVDANAGTPCMRNARSLLVCALAAARQGDDERARELERAADALGLLGRQVLDAPRLRLALARGDRRRAEQLLASLLDEEGWYARGHGTSLATLTTRLDALAALGQGDRVEREAGLLLRPGTYLEPFALRALGIARADTSLVERAHAAFENLGLHWHAAETAVLLPTSAGG